MKKEEFPPFDIRFYDAFDGWGEISRNLAGIQVGKVTFPESGVYETLREAIGACDELMSTLEKNNRDMGEHYSVFDARDNEVHRGY
jgi:hypothetical protein